MSTQNVRGRERVLDPIERSSEILFALIMVLSFTGSISVATAAGSAEAREEVKEVLIGAIGCNLAWGIIDAVMYLMMIRIEHGRDFALGRAVRESKDPAAGRALLADALPHDLGEVFDADALERARAKLVQRPTASSPRLSGRDWQGAFGVFLLVFVSTFPVVVPFLFVTPLHTAMRTSNAVAMVMLYVTGHILGKHGGMRPFLTGLVMVAIGAVLVAVTIALGG